MAYERQSTSGQGGPRFGQVLMQIENLIKRHPDTKGNALCDRPAMTSAFGDYRLYKTERAIRLMP